MRDAWPKPWEAHGTDHVAAFKAYQDGLEAFVAEVQERADKVGMTLIFPADEAELAERDRKLRDHDYEL